MDPSKPEVTDPVYCQRNAAGNALIVTSVITMVVGAILFSLRMYARLSVIKRFGWDDITLAIAWPLSIVGCALQWTMIDLGMGKHGACTSFNDNMYRTKIEWVTTTVLGFSVIFTRCSVVLMIVRIFGVSSRVRWALYGFMTFMALSLGITILLLWGVCTPIAAIWDPLLLKDATCWSDAAMNGSDYYNGAVSIFSDLFLALLPGYFISKLQMSWRIKAGVSALMGVGILTSACAMARTILNPTEQDVDPSYNGAILLVFGTLEMNMALIAASIPGLPALFKQYNSDSSPTGFRSTLWSVIRRGRPSANNSRQGSFTKAMRMRDTDSSSGGSSSHVTDTVTTNTHAHNASHSSQDLQSPHIMVTRDFNVDVA